MDIFENAQGKSVLLKMAKAIQEKKAYLGEVDGLIGDGDHGMNMNKGFRVFEERIKDRDIGFVQGLGELGEILFNEIGGSMGPIYGTLFMDASEAGEGKEEIGTEELAQMLEAGLCGLYEIVEARVGDKTMVDTLAPAVASLKSSVKEGVPLGEALLRMKVKAEAGRDSTIGLIARYGRSSRLGERSREVPDAGAVSCCIILCALADGIDELMKDAEGGRI